MTLPETKSMPPSAARATLVAYLLERLKASSTYTYAHALDEMRPDECLYAWCVLDVCWEEAKAEYDRLYPKENSLVELRYTEDLNLGINPD